MYKSHIALEVRILLQTGTKTFCGCRYPNSGIPESCPLCREAGELQPQLNPEAAVKAYLTARALGCALVDSPRYERNISTPELPADYALSGLSLKIAEHGAIDILFHRRHKRISIAELRIEEDAGRLTHTGSQTRMDYSTAGQPSLRIRTESDFEMGEEAEIFLSALRRRIQYLEIISVVPVESLIRCNAHVAIAVFPEKPETYVKLRNLNSFNFVRKAINVELGRQEDILTSGGSVVAESRIWNEARNAVEPFQKRKTESKPRFIRVEYLSPFSPPPEVAAALEATAVELPETRRDRLAKNYGLTNGQAEAICDEKSRADYYEQLIAAGTDPKEAAVWLLSFLLKELKRSQLTFQNFPISPEVFAALLAMISQRRIHSGIVKQAVIAALAENHDPLTIIAERGWEQLSDRGAIENLVRKVLAANPAEVQKVREGNTRTIHYLTGRIMQEAKGLAEPALVKEVLKDQLSVSLVYILSFGGVISGRQPSEELVPADWATLITAIADRLNSGTANGIVIGHGPDTLAFTAPLIYWLFADAEAPIVLAAASAAPSAESLAALSLKTAINLATGKQRGVYVVYDGQVFSPINLKFERLGRDGFRNWNLDQPIHEGGSLLIGSLEADQYVFTQLLEEAVNSLSIVRLYPGLRADHISCLFDQGVRHIFLELFGNGSLNLSEGPYSLKKALSLGRRKGVRFYCCSQQAAKLGQSDYATSHALWQAGAIPMGPLTTESAVARFLAASILADNEDERNALVELDFNA